MPGGGVLVHTRAVHQRPSRAPGIGGQRGDRPGVMRLRRGTPAQLVKPDHQADTPFPHNAAQRSVAHRQRTATPRGLAWPAWSRVALPGTAWPCLARRGPPDIAWYRAAVATNVVSD